MGRQLVRTSASVVLWRPVRRLATLQTRSASARRDSLATDSSAKTTRAEIGQQILPARWRRPLRPTASSGFTLRAATSSHSSKHSLHKNPSRVLLSDPLKDTYPPPPQLFLFLPLPVLHHASNVVRWQHSKNLHLIISNIPLDHFPSLT